MTVAGASNLTRQRFGGGLTGLLHVAALFVLLLAQPVYDLLSRHAAFFVAHGLEPRQLVAVVALSAVALPTALWLATAVLLAPLRRSQQSVPLLLGVIAAIGAIPLLERGAGAPSGVAVPAAAIVGVLFAWGYLRTELVRTATGFAALAIVACPVAFLLLSPVRALVVPAPPEARGAGAGSDAPVFVIVFDEFPTVALLDRDAEIDAHHFPSFARLAREGHWFRNASTVSHGTEAAVPALLSGRFPEPDQLPILRDHASNLLTLLSPSHRVFAFETVTDLCPRDVCEKTGVEVEWSTLISDLGIVAAQVLAPSALRPQLPSVGGRWAGFADEKDAAGQAPDIEERRWRASKKRIRQSVRRRDIFRDFTSSIGSRRGVLHFVHVLLPHIPYQFLPDGRFYTRESHLPGWTRSQGRWRSDAVLVAQGYQRLLLQVAFVDGLVGELLDHLDRLGIYDEALIVVTADHGVNFVPGLHRRRVTDETLPTVLPIPLFIKEPGQRKGRIHDGNVETIDVLPTIAGILELDLASERFGPSVLDPEWKERSEKRIRFKGIRSFPRDLLPAMRAAIDQKYSLFGMRDGAIDFYAHGVHAEIIGRPSATLARMSTSRDLSFTLAHPERLVDVSLSSEYLPALIRGTLSGREARSRSIAVIVNGVVAGSTRAFESEGEIRFGAVVSPDLLREGRNAVELATVEEQAGRFALRPIPVREADSTSD